MLLPGKSICLIIHLSRKTHDLITEDPSVHFLQILGDRRPEFHLRQDILLQVYARSDLRQCQHTVDQFEDSALSDVKHLLSDLCGIFGRKRDLLYILDELLDFSFLQDVLFFLFDLEIL